MSNAPTSPGAHQMLNRRNVFWLAVLACGAIFSVSFFVLLEENARSITIKSQQERTLASIGVVKEYIDVGNYRKAIETIATSKSLIGGEVVGVSLSNALDESVISYPESFLSIPCGVGSSATTVVALPVLHVCHAVNPFIHVLVSSRLSISYKHEVYWATGIFLTVMLVSMAIFSYLAGRFLKGSFQQLASTIIMSLRGDSSIVEIDPLFSSVFSPNGLAGSGLDELKSAMYAQAQANAIARMVQMLAHDVRKPFSTLEIGMKMVKSAKSSDEMRAFADLTISSVKMALVSVNGMIDDVMEIGRTSTPIASPCRVECLLDASLSEVFQTTEKAKISIEYRLIHSRLAAVEQAKVVRVLSNILSNALQAMKKEGHILICGEDVTMGDVPYVRITIGNNGPLIPKTALPEIFNAFFTSGKVGGTGLGLAIAKKVVEAHGGKITCASPGRHMPVEFSFTLPVDGACSHHNSTAPRLPSSSDEIYERLKPKNVAFSPQSACDLIADPREEGFEKNLIAATADLGRPLRVAVVDDELIYRESVGRLIGDASVLSNSVAFSLQSSATQAVQDGLMMSADAVVCDVDLGTDFCNGYDVVRTLRGKGYTGHICIHSNRSLPEDFRHAIDAGADTVFPKPMSRAHLLQILAAAAERAIAAKVGTSHQTSELHAFPSSFPFRFAVIEDDRIVRSAWHEAFGECVSIFPSAEDLLGDGTIMEQVRDALSPFDFIVTDFHLDEEGPIPTGAMVATIVQRFHPMPVFLCSSVDWDEPLHSKLFAGHLSKFDDFRQKTQELVERAGLQPRGQSGAKRPSPSRANPLAQVSQSKQPDGKYTLEQLTRLRHDLRNHLANVQIVASRLRSARSSDAAEDAKLALSALAEVAPYCDQGLVSNLGERLQVLSSHTANWTEHTDLITEIVGLAQELTLAHHTDPAWIDLETNPLLDG